MQCDPRQGVAFKKRLQTLRGAPVLGSGVAGRLATADEPEAFWFEVLSQPLRLPKEILSSLAIDSSVREPHCLALLRACSLNSVEYRFLCLLGRSGADHPR